MERFSPEQNYHFEPEAAKGQEKMPKYSERWRKFFEENKQQIKKNLVKVVGASVLFGAAAIEPYKAVAQKLSFRDASVASEKLKRAESKEVIQKDALTDLRERVFAEVGGQYYELQTVGARNGVVDYDKLEMAIRDNNATEATMTHTHPLETYEEPLSTLNWSPERIKQTMTSKDLPPEPPSMMDYIGQYDAEKTFQKKGITLKGRVLDPEGEWTYSIGQNNHLIDGLRNANDVLTKLQRDHITSHEWQIIRTTLDSGQVDPRLLSDYLRSVSREKDPRGEMKALADKLDQLSAEASATAQKEIDVYSHIEEKGVQVMASEAGAAREQVIKEYIQLCGQYGIKVEYKHKPQ